MKKRGGGLMKKNFIILIMCLLIFPLRAGATWTTKRLTWNSGFSEKAQVALDSFDNINVVWSDDTPGNQEIYFKRSTNGGSSWMTKRLTWNTGMSIRQVLAVDSNDNIYVVWNDDSLGNDELFLKKTTNGGISWTTKRLTWTPDFSYDPTIAIDSNDHIYIAWNERVSSKWEIFLKKSTDGGANWTTQRLTWNSYDSCIPKLAVDSNDNVYVVWNEFNSDKSFFEIFIRKSTDGGSNWTTQRLTWNSGISAGPSIMTDSLNYIHVFWYDSTSGNNEIYYKKSINGGVSWLFQRLTWNTGDSYHPVGVVNSSSKVIVVWWDLTPGNSEIYFKVGN
jgi:hypothetical protein